MTLSQTLRLIAEDTRERARLASKRYGVFSYAKLLFDPPALTVASYRLQHWLHSRGWRFLTRGLRWLSLVLFSADIDAQAEIGANFMLLHTNCVSIGGRVRIGRNVILVHHNTIATGPRPDESADHQVTIADNVIVGCGARIIGNLSIGHDSFIGAGSVVMASLPEYSFHFAEPGEVADELIATDS